MSRNLARGWSISGAMHSSSILRVASTVIWVLVIGTSTAVADADDSLAKPDSPAAREHLTSGNKLYRLREFEKATEEYKAGALIEDAPVFHYNLGQCYRQLGRYEEAIWHYDRFLDRGKPTGQIRGAVEAFRTQMKAELDKKAMTQPPIEPAPDTKPAPETKPAAPLPSETHSIGVSGEAWYEDGVGWGLAATGLVGLGASGWLFIDANHLEDKANDQSSQSERNDLRDRASSRRTLGWFTGGAGVALLAAGIVKLALRPHDRDRTMAASLGLGLGSSSVYVTGRF